MTVTPLSIRRKQVLKLADFSTGHGLEIGPLNQPLVTKDMADVRYVDVFSGSHLRAHYAQDPNVNVQDIPDIDFVLSTPDGVRPLSEAVAAAALLLVVPDRRFSFDILRPATTVGQLLQAHELREVRPSVRAVYDHFRSQVVVDASDARRGLVPARESRMYDLAQTMNQVRFAQEGHYADSHVWTFTPASFVQQLSELGELGLCDFVVEQIVPSAVNQLEFFAVLRRRPVGPPSQDVTSVHAGPVLDVVDEDPVAFRAKAESERLAAQARRLTLEVARLQAELDASIRVAGQRTKDLEDELAQVKASERWRLGGLAAGPASALKRLFVR